MSHDIRVGKPYRAAACQEVHGHARIPHDYSDPAQPGWVEAARWLQKSAKLFLKGKLPDKRYAMITETLGAHRRPMRRPCTLVRRSGCLKGTPVLGSCAAGGHADALLPSTLALHRLLVRR